MFNTILQCILKIQTDNNQEKRLNTIYTSTIFITDSSQTIENEMNDSVDVSVTSGIDSTSVACD